ncbi:MAG: hypothetical protein ACE5GS_13925 [Kiloniellaceae bacterium]
MKLLVLLTFGALVLGTIYYEYSEDIALALSEEGARGVVPATQSVGNLGNAVGRNMQGIADKLGQ